MSYYISSGAKTMMYTLRQRYTEERSTAEGVMTVERDEYSVNLSTDYNKAVAKARGMVGDKLCLTGEFSLEAIRRREQAEIEARELCVAEDAERERLGRIEAGLQKVEDGLWPFGQFYNKEFKEADSGYIQYFGNIKIEEADPVPELLKKMLRKIFPELFLPIPTANGKHYGKEGSREAFVATVVERFTFETFYGCSTILKMVKDSGELLLYMGGAAPEGDKGQTFSFNATIKEHGEYEKEKQTKIQRIAKWTCNE